MPQIIVSLLFIAMVVTAGWLIVVSNNMVEKKAEADTAWEQIVQQLLIKADVVVMIYETVSKHRSQEEDLVLKILEVKANLVSTNSIDKAMQSAQELNRLQQKTIDICLGNPELTATEEYLKREDKLKKIETELTIFLQQYNHAVNQQRIYIRTFPNNVASMIIGVKNPMLIRNEDSINSIQ